MSKPVKRVLALFVPMVLTAACSSTTPWASRGEDQVEAGEAGLSGVDGPGGPGATDSTVAGPGGVTAVPGATPGSTGPGAAGTKGPGTTVGPGGPGAFTGKPYGRGVTDTTVKIGFIAADEGVGNAGYGNAGLKNIDTGPQAASARAMVDWLNANGGIRGRRVEAIVHVISSIDEPAWCRKFGEDNQVLAVILPHQGVTMPSCMAAKQTMLLHEDSTLGDEEDFRRYAPYYYAPSWLNQTRNAKIYVDGLVAQGFFTPGAKIGLLRYDSATHARAAQVLKARLAHHGLSITEEVAGKGLNDSSWAGLAVTNFRRAGINKLLILDFKSQMVTLYGAAAEGAAYNSVQYGLNSSSLWDFTAANVGGQYDNAGGAVGVGHRPIDDVKMTDHNATIKKCFEIYRAKGIQLNSSNAMRYNIGYCDLVFFLKAGFDRASALNATAFNTAVSQMGSAFEPALTFGTRFGPGATGGPSQVRYARFNAACQCFKYTSASVGVQH